ncbi:MAG: tryptophan synthase subunit alpha [Gemmatales bacterium]|nr:tryptophan synthase subunit alpha [Gemmatales bacterium]MDW7994698.1 tryptophan synthase subunit alpha [Gemmatales bacterium]
MNTVTGLSPTNPLERRFAALRQRGGKALITFVPAGDPHLEATRDLLNLLAHNGADVIEIGLPYSDPIADGPLIQGAYTRALSRGIHVRDVFELVRSWSASPALSARRLLEPGSIADLQETTSQMSLSETSEGRPQESRGASPQASVVTVPLVAMASYSLIYRQTERRFVEQCVASGISGVIVPDLPAEEASSLAALCHQHDLALIQLVAPTTPLPRARDIVSRCTGFVYCVSVVGITGVRDHLPEELRQRLQTLRTLTKLPLCVGFGISRPEHVQMIKPYADGIIVGSALVSRLAEAANRPWEEVSLSIGQLLGQLRQALDEQPTS